MYATREQYESYYGEITEQEYNRLSIEADRYIDVLTTGIDNVRKLKVAFPVEDADNIVYCACRVTNILKQIADAEASAASARGYTEGANGLQGKVVSSVSSGNESVSFGTASAELSAIDKAIADPAEKDKLIKNIVKIWLSGISDSNGVNLLYMGRYPEEHNV